MHGPDSGGLHRQLERERKLDAVVAVQLLDRKRQRASNVVEKMQATPVFFNAGTQYAIGLRSSAVDVPFKTIVQYFVPNRR
jgi:hypothetical protein